MRDSPVIDVSGEQMRFGFDLWAEVYDDQPNPLIALEERVLSQLLPPLRGRDVLDAGCGTGRWLDRVAASEPRSLTGVDASVDDAGQGQDQARHKGHASPRRLHTACRSAQPRAMCCFAPLC